MITGLYHNNLLADKLALGEAGVYITDNFVVEP
jgi:hypothetical protein